MKAQMFIIAAIFIVGLAFFVQQALFRYSSLDISEPMRTNDYYAFRSVNEMINYTIKTTGSCESGKDNFRQNLGEIESLLSKESANMGYITSISYDLNCSKWNNKPPDPGPLDLTLYTTGLGTETKGSFNLVNPTTCCSQPSMFLRFDEGSGTTVRDSGCKGNDGTINDSTRVPGKIGSALQFDGIDDYVNISDDSSLKGGSQITVILWVRPNQNGTYGFVDKHRDQEWSVHTSDGRVRFQGRNINNNPIRFTANSSTPRLTVNEWTHVAVTYNAIPPNNKHIYYNGIDLPIYHNDNNNGTILSNTNKVYIGRLHDAYYLNGTIDEVLVYNRTLSQAEIQEHYNSGPPCS
jgi:hypothetical protein